MSATPKNITGKIGTYAISTVGFDCWIDEPVSQPAIKTKRSRNVKQVVNKIFEDCAKCIQDPFWIEKFNSAAINKFPQKFSFHGGILSYKRGTKYTSLEVSNNPYEAAHGCMEFFRVNGNIFSPMDQQNSINIQCTRASNAHTREPITWENSSKKVQECLLSYYISDTKILMNLREKEVLQLRQTVKLAISGKYFDKSNISVSEDRIQSITGLLWDNKERRFYVDPNIKPNVTRSYSRKKDDVQIVGAQQKDSIPQFNIKWRKYVESLDKKIVRNERYKRCIVVDNSDFDSVLSDCYSTTAGSLSDDDNSTEEDGTTDS